MFEKPTVRATLRCNDDPDDDYIEIYSSGREDPAAKWGVSVFGKDLKQQMFVSLADLKALAAWIGTLG